MTKESYVEVEATVETVQVKTEAEKVQVKEPMRPKVQPKQQISDVRAEKEAYTETKEAVKSEEITRTVTEKPKKLEQTPVTVAEKRLEQVSDVTEVKKTQKSHVEAEETEPKTLLVLKKAPEKTSESVEKVPEASAEKKRRPEEKQTVKKSKLEKMEEKTSDVVTDLTTKTMDFVEEEAAQVEEKITVKEFDEVCPDEKSQKLDQTHKDEVCEMSKAAPTKKTSEDTRSFKDDSDVKERKDEKRNEETQIQELEKSKKSDVETKVNLTQKISDQIQEETAASFHDQEEEKKLKSPKVDDEVGKIKVSDQRVKMSDEKKTKVTEVKEKTAPGMKKGLSKDGRSSLSEAKQDSDKTSRQKDPKPEREVAVTSLSEAEEMKKSSPDQTDTFPAQTEETHLSPIPFTQQKETAASFQEQEEDKTPNVVDDVGKKKPRVLTKFWIKESRFLKRRRQKSLKLKRKQLLE
ncbi:hypothetical protein WMY93_002270 [Mugilogobius chulae]|uniref:Uncharacterized protein n=1 Tax=Mugilogobius chulae TaxID=88201 RepID=A0AAW0PWA9_9GOBI